MRGEFSQLHRGQYRGRQPVVQIHVVTVVLTAVKVARFARHGLTPAVLTTWNWGDSPRTG